MWIIVGLGNPGRKYAHTRHNIGFMVADELSRRIQSPFKKSELYESSGGFLGNEKIVLIKPSTFMNRSGSAVSSALHYFKSTPSRLIVIHDDLDMEVGRLKLKKGGGSGGHKGIESIIQTIGKEFLRIKIGIGKPDQEDTEGYVLGKCSKEERELISFAVSRAADAADTVIQSGYSKAMSLFNA